MTYHIIITGNFQAVVAPPGWTMRSDGSGYYRDNAPAPEHGPLAQAYKFKTHRAAARVLSKMGSDARIVTIGGHA